MLNNPLRKEIVKDETTFVFRLPTGRDILQIGMKTRELNGGPGMPMDGVYAFADQIATLQVLCEMPKSYDFAALPFHQLTSLSKEVGEWIGSFRDDVEGK